jgi:excisionase family DNA binding protein
MGQKITLAETAERLGVSKDSVRRLISSGELRAYRIGNQQSVRVDTDDLAAVLKPIVPNGKTA